MFLCYRIHLSVCLHMKTDLTATGFIAMTAGLVERHTTYPVLIAVVPLNVYTDAYNLHPLDTC